MHVVGNLSTDSFILGSSAIQLPMTLDWIQPEALARASFQGPGPVEPSIVSWIKKDDRSIVWEGKTVDLKKDLRGNCPSSWYV